jgi:hypothetical protein
MGNRAGPGARIDILYRTGHYLKQVARPHQPQAIPRIEVLFSLLKFSIQYRQSPERF